MCPPGAARTIRRMLRPALLALLATATVPAAAQALPAPHRVAFDVQTSATGSMKVHYHRQDPSSLEMVDETYKIDFSYESDYQDVTIVDGRLADTGVRPIQNGVVHVLDATVVERYANGDGATYDCDDPEIVFRGEGQIANDDFSSDVSTRLMWRPAEQMNIGMACHSPNLLWHTGWDLTQPGGEEQKPIGQGPVDLHWDIPYEVLWMDHYEQLVEQEPFQKDMTMCPGFAYDKTVDCVLEWSGKVTMDRVRDGDVPVGEDDGSDADVVIDVPAPVPPAPGSPPVSNPAPPAPAPPASTPRPAPKATGGRLARDRRHVTFTVACPTGAPCSGTARAEGAKAKRFVVAAGARKTITLTLAKAARRGTRVTVSVALTPKGGRTTKAMFKV